MEKFKPTVISKEFVAAATDAIQNQNALSFTDSVASSAVLSDDQAMNNNYQKSQGYSRDVNGIVTGYKNADTNTIVANVKISNHSLSADVKISTVMIFANYNGNKILVATSRLNNPELLPAFDSDKGTPVTIELAVYIQVSDIADAKVQFNDAGLATNADLQHVDGSAVHNTGDEKVDGVKTFVQPIKGVADINVRKLWDGYDLDSLKSAGMYAANNVKVLQSSNAETFSLIVESSGSAVKQTKSVFNSDGTNSTYVRYFRDTWSNFKLVPMDDSQVVHNNSDGTINGNLTVTGALHATADYAYKNVPIEIADGTDLNNLREQGNYYCTTHGMKNSPVPNWITLVVVKNGYWNGTQTLTDTNTGETYVRVWNTGGDWFSAWEKVAVDSKIVHNSGDETISGNKKFSNKIDGSITGTATHADSASYADITPHATYADTAEHAKDIYHDADIKVASLYASSGISSDGNLKVGGSFSSKIINYEMDTDIGVHASLQRTGNLVIVHVYGELAGSAARDIGNVPLGFRPKGQIAYGFISVGGFSRLAVSPDGSFRLIDNLNGGWATGTVTYNTADDFPY